MSISNKTHFDIQLEDNFATEHLRNENRACQNRLRECQNRLDESKEIINELIRIIEQDQTDIYRSKLKLTPKEILMIDHAKTKEL
jgi:hypothetical protein|tara:strand:- start:1291 stop:1545 length:255 start_codon:yes stop_codon:yes gene_type:complete